MVRAILNESPWRLRFKGESHITVALFPGDFPPKPAGRFEFATARAIGKFHLRHDQTGMSPAIDIELDQPVVPGNFVAHFSQSSAAVPGQSAANCLGLSLISRSSRWVPRRTLNVSDAVCPRFRRRTCLPAHSVAR